MQLAAFGANKPCRSQAEGSCLRELVARVLQSVTNSTYAAARDGCTSMAASHPPAGQDAGTMIAQVLSQALQSLMYFKQNEINLQINRASSSASSGRTSSSETLALMDAAPNRLSSAPQLALPAPPVASVAPTTTESALQKVMGVPRAHLQKFFSRIQ